MMPRKKRFVVGTGTPLSIGLALAIALSFGLAEAAHAQAGAEAAIITSQSAQWAKKYGSQTGSSVSDVFQYMTGSITVRRGDAGYVPPQPKKRPRSGAPGSVEGTVLFKDTGEPLAGVTVTLVSTELEYVQEILRAKSNASGKFTFGKVEPGRWAVGLDPDQLSSKYAPARYIEDLKIGRSQKISLQPIRLIKAACVHGLARWTDGLEVSDGMITIAPLDTSMYALATTLSETGSYELCSVPPDSAMVWIDLYDGRTIGYGTRINADQENNIDFQTVPMNQLPTTLVWFDIRNESGTGVGYSEVLIVGRSPGTAERPAMVYARIEVTDRQGFVEYYLPFGVYDVLAINPREGQHGKLSNLQVTPQTQNRANHEIIIRGESSEGDRVRMVDGMLDRADFFIYNWGVF